MVVPNTIVGSKWFTLPQKQLEEHVDRLLAAASKAQRAAIVRAFFGISHKDLRYFREGGGEEDGDAWGPYPIYRLFERAEIEHDFGDEPAMKVAHAIPHPKEMRAEDFHTERAFLQRMGKTRAFHFAGEEDALPNPMFCLNPVDFLFPTEGFACSSSDMDGLRRRQSAFVHGKWSHASRIQPAAVLSHVATADMPWIELKEVAELIGRMRMQFRGATSCVVEPNVYGTYLVRIVLGIRKVEHVLNAKFRTVPYAADWEDLSEKLRARVAAYLHEHGEGEVLGGWESVSRCDATIFDPSDGMPGVTVDERPTGPIFHPRCPTQVWLGGVLPQGRKTVVQVRDVSGGTTVHFEVGAKETTRALSIRNLRNQMSQKRTATPRTATPPHTLEEMLPTWAPETLLALKRAGDWGQVEHCRRYHKVFITADVMATAYAIFRGVACMLVHAETMDEDETIERWSFALCRAGRTVVHANFMDFRSLI